jgi:hypothetical protein
LITDNPAVVPHQPYNVIRVSAYDSMSNNGDNTLLKLIKYLTYLRYQTNVVNYIMNFPFDEKRDWNIVSDPARDRMLTQFTKNGDPVTNKQKQKKESKAQKKANQSQQQQQQQQVNSKTQKNNAQPQETSRKAKKRRADSDPGLNKKLKTPSGTDTKTVQVGQTSSNTANVSQNVKEEQQKREEQKRKEDQKRREDQRRREEQKKKDEQRRREEQKKADQRRREEQRKKEQKQKERQNRQNDTYEADVMDYEQSPLISQKELKEIVDKFTESICAEIAAMDARDIM